MEKSCDQLVMSAMTGGQEVVEGVPRICPLGFLQILIMLLSLMIHTFSVMTHSSHTSCPGRLKLNAPLALISGCFSFSFDVRFST